MLLNLFYTLGLAALTSQVSAFATSIYLHRTLAHRALALHPLVAFPMRLWLWLMTGIMTKQWVGIHRKHHRFTDIEGDPHSPVLKGLWKVLIGNAYYYAREARNKETLARYAPDIGNDWFDRRVFRSGLVGLGVGMVLYMLVLGPAWGVFGFLLQAGVYIFSNAVINGAGHAVGYRNFENTATNMRLVALVTAGEGLHNNHHAFPTSARFSLRKFEFDPSWIVIRLLSLLRLARPLKLAEEQHA